MNRAYSLITVKQIDESKRVVEGIATTPSTDHVGDIVEPEGAEFDLPLPFLWQHDSEKPVGHVTWAKPNSKGIPVRIQIEKTDEPGIVKDRLDEAWQSLKLRLVRGLSIGFKAIEYARIEGTNGYRFIKWKWLELSAVTIPANQEATIQTVKSLDTALRAASGRVQPAVVRLTPPAPGTTQPKTPQEGTTMKTVSEQISALETKRAATAAAMQALAQKSVESGETFDQADQESFDASKAEIDAIDGQLKRLKDMESILAAGAKPVRTVENAPAPTPGVTVKTPEKPEPGIRMARYVRCIGLAHKEKVDVLRVAKNLYGERDPVVVDMIGKAAGTAIGALNSTTDSSLIGNEGVIGDFVEFLRAQTIIGKFGMNGIPALRRIPFRVPLVSQATGGTAYWVGEGDGKPLTKPSFGRTELAPLKVAAIAVSTMELLRDSSPAAERMIRDDLASAVISRLDVTFVGPSVTANAGINPASITNGAEAIASTATTDADAIRLEVRSVMQKFIDALNPLTSGAWIMSSSTALALAMMTNTLGQAEFPGININGGTFMGLPVIVSDHVTDYVVLVNAGDIWFGDEGGLQIDMSDQASLQMVAGDDEGATINSVTPTAAQLVSLWQTNSVAFRAERTVNWARRRTSAVAYLTDVDWGGTVLPS
jgi:HK97 family phage major capsid protein/HK97 family phage prohead protease